MVDRQAFRLLQLHDLFMPQVNIALFKEGISLIKWVTNVYKMDYQLASYSPDRKNLNGGGGGVCELRTHSVSFASSMSTKRPKNNTLVFKILKNNSPHDILLITHGKSFLLNPRYITFWLHSLWLPLPISCLNFFWNSEIRSGYELVLWMMKLLFGGIGIPCFEWAYFSGNIPKNEECIFYSM